MASKSKRTEREKQHPPPGFFSLRGLILALIMIGFASILKNAELGGINTYAVAYDARIGFYSDKLDSLSQISSWRQRMFLRHVANYEIPLWIAENKRPGDTILLPPAEYSAPYIVAQTIWTDPRIFTYFAGFQPIIAYSDTVRRQNANAWVVLQPQAIYLARRGGRFDIDSLLRVYQDAHEGVGGKR